MPLQLFTAEDIRRLARERVETLVLAPDDIVTHEATDTAFALGMKLIRETESSFAPALSRAEGPAAAALTFLASAVLSSYLVYRAGFVVSPALTLFVATMSAMAMWMALRRCAAGDARAPLGPLGSRASEIC